VRPVGVAGIAADADAGVLATMPSRSRQTARLAA
jgi:hypothetical protein